MRPGAVVVASPESLVLHRLLALLVALATLLPVQAWARVGELCQSEDACACRHDDEAPQRTAAQRPDCCAAPIAIESAPCPAQLQRGQQLIALAAIVELEPSLLPAMRDVAVDSPRERTRGPPQRLHRVIQHWLL